MKTTDKLPQKLKDEAAELWIVENPNHPDIFGTHMFRSLDDATAWVTAHVAKRLPLTADLKHDGDDDEMLPPGAVTALRWSCPLRRMTQEECLATGSRYAHEWIKYGSHPNTPDWDMAERQQITFIGERSEHIFITRVSRYLGYLDRSGVLNDKTKDVARLIQAWKSLA